MRGKNSDRCGMARQKKNRLNYDVYSNIASTLMIYEKHLESFIIFESLFSKIIHTPAELWSYSNFRSNNRRVHDKIYIYPILRYDIQHCIEYIHATVNHLYCCCFYHHYFSIVINIFDFFFPLSNCFNDKNLIAHECI